MRKRWLAVPAIGGILLVGVVVMRGPQPGHDASCAACRIELSKVATVGENAGPLSPRQSSTLAMNTRGEYAVTRPHDFTRVVLYGADGKLKTSWGRKGRGPGEFTQIAHVAWLSDDTVLVIDSYNRRLSVWLTDSTLVSEREFGESGEMHFRSDRKAYLHRRNAAGSSPRPPFLIWSQDAEPVEFGAVGELNERTNSRLNSLKTGLAGDSLWVAEVNAYRLSLYAPDGSLVRQLNREAKWYHGVQFNMPGMAMTLLRGTINMTEAITSDEHGRVWVAIHHGYVRKMLKTERGRRKAATEVRRERPPASPAQMEPVSDYILEVLEPGTGKPIATRVFEAGTFGGFIDGRHLWTVRELDDGQIVFDVWRFSLAGAT